MKDALGTLGMLISEDEQRDAVHIAVVPAIAGETASLRPGQKCRLHSDGETAFLANSDEAIGLVDPFLDKNVLPGQRFWLCLYPRTITSLRHVWTHPSLDEPSPAKEPDTSGKDMSEEWLTNWCSRNDCPDWAILKQGFEGTLHTDGYYKFRYDDFGGSEQYLFVGAYDGHAEIPDEFWHHVDIVMGRKVQRAKYFSCSC